MLDFVYHYTFIHYLANMIQLLENVDLTPYNTFGIKATCKYFVKITNRQEYLELLKHEAYQSYPHLILGGGSNVLFKTNYEGIVIKDELKGIEVQDQSEDFIRLKVAGGENWHQFVMFCVQHNYGGLENLSLIPGSVGAAPIQNIGAYGVEVKELIDEVTVWNTFNGEEERIAKSACNFGYRDSAFKNEWRGKYFISSVTLTLTKKNHRFNISYGAIQDTLKHLSHSEVDIQSIAQAVIHIRQSKLPDPTVIGNAGSFFKNPEISTTQFETLKRTHTQLPGYVSGDQQVKIPAGWLIEQCQWKGKRIRDAGVHTQQALVLVNYGNASGEELLSLAQHIQSSVHEKFNIMLTPEVNVI